MGRKMAKSIELKSMVDYFLKVYLRYRTKMYLIQMFSGINEFFDKQQVFPP